MQTKLPSRRFRFAPLIFSLLGCSCLLAPAIRGNDAPSWMHAVANAPLPEHDEKTDAVLLFSEEILTVQPNGKMKEIDRAAYKILRPDGRHYGKWPFYFDDETKISSLHGWSIPASGKDYEVKDKDTIETGYNSVAGGELFSNLHFKWLEIPAAEPGNVVGYEIEREQRPFVFQDEWIVQKTVPVREAHYTLQLPQGWEYKAVWLNHAEVVPTSSGNNQFQWTVRDLPGIKHEHRMPPYLAVATQMIIHIYPPSGSGAIKSFATWNDMGKWYGDLWKSRGSDNPQIRQKVAELTKSSPSKLAQMRALAGFIQDDIRYVAIELGIGGWQPHMAEDVFVHKYGDCKDKSNLLSAMLRQVGIESFHVAINTNRGVVGPDVPPRLGIFNHSILAIRLPDEANDPALLAVVKHPQFGRLLYFDPTDEETPFGFIRGELQANYALLVTPQGGELLPLPTLPLSITGISRQGRLTVDSRGLLQGSVQEVRVGDFAMWQRYSLRKVEKDADRIKPVESLMAHSLSTFQITKASITNLSQRDMPFKYDWTFYSQNYAKTAGNLLLLRPRVVGTKADDILETKEPRKYPVEFEGPRRDTDTFEIKIPAGYEVDELPPPIDADYSFGSYHSKTEVAGDAIRYTRTFEIKELSVPTSKVDDLKKFYRIIASDERNTAVLKPVVH
jgi:transglutaminase-like putative cysteine protease